MDIRKEVDNESSVFTRDQDEVRRNIKYIYKQRRCIMKLNINKCDVSLVTYWLLEV